MKRNHLKTVNKRVHAKCFFADLATERERQFTCKNNHIYYINTNEIQGELSRENMISSHVKITCYLHM